MQTKQLLLFANRLIVELKNQPVVFLWFGVIFFFIVYTGLTFGNHFFVRTNALDYGFHIQAFWNFAHLRDSASTIFEPHLNSFFQVHPIFTLPLLSPLYWVLSPIFGTYTLLFIQNIFVLLGGYFTYLFIKEKTNSYLIGLLAFFHFNLTWGHYSALAFEYIDATVAASVVPAFLFYFHKQKTIPAILAFLFVLTSRENMSVWLMFIGVFLFFEYYRNRCQRMAAAGIIILSAAYLVFIKTVLVPFFEDPTYPYWGFPYSALGDNIPQAIAFIFTNPLETIRLLFVNHIGDPIYDGIKVEFWYVFLLSGGILVFLRPIYGIILIPVIAQKLYSDNYMQWGLNIFYSIEVLSVLTISAFCAVGTALSNKKLKVIVLAALCLVTAATTVVKMNSRTSKWYIKEKENIFHRSFYSTPYTIKDLREPLKLIPDEAKVCASEKLVPHLAERSYITMIPYIHESEYVLYLSDTHTYPLNSEQYEDFGDNLHQSEEWTVIYDEYPLTIFIRANDKNDSRTH